MDSDEIAQRSKLNFMIDTCRGNQLSQWAERLESRPPYMDFYNGMDVTDLPRKQWQITVLINSQEYQEINKSLGRLLCPEGDMQPINK